MELSLLCNEVWLMSPAQENDEDTHVNQDSVDFLLDQEKRNMPPRGYSNFLKTNVMIHNARFEAVNLIIWSHMRMNLSAGTCFLAVNYLDRFISVTRCRDWKYCMFELLSLSCLSIAAKFNETATSSLQVERVHKWFAPTLIQQMEMTVLKSLDWRMDSTTPFSYLHILTQSVVDKDDFNKYVTDLLLCALLDPEFLEFHQCVIAVSAVRCAFEDSFSSAINGPSLIAYLDNVIPQYHKDDLIKCYSIMTKLMSRDEEMLARGEKSYWTEPSSPVTVLKVPEIG